MDEARGAREKNLTLLRNVRVHAMYPASDCSRCGYCFATCLDKFWPASLSRFFIGLLLTFLIFAVVGWLH
jgi:hypothetical protein